MILITVLFLLLPSSVFAGGEGGWPSMVQATFMQEDVLKLEQEFRDRELPKLHNWNELAKSFAGGEGSWPGAIMQAELYNNNSLKHVPMNHNYYPSSDGVNFRDIDLSGLMFTDDKIPANADMDAILEAVIAIQPMQPMNRDIHAGMKVHTSVRFLGEYDGTFMVETKTGGRQEIFDLSEQELEQYPWMYNAALISSQLDGRTVILN